MMLHSIESDREIAYENRWKMKWFSVGSMMETRVIHHLR
jgi:hypothetical protein